MTANAKFDRIVDLEDAVRIGNTINMFRGAGVSDYRAAQNEASELSARTKLAAAIAELTPEEMVEFGKYRLEVRK